MVDFYKKEKNYDNQLETLAEQKQKLENEIKQERAELKN